MTKQLSNNLATLWAFASALSSAIGIDVTFSLGATKAKRAYEQGIDGNKKLILRADCQLAVDFIIQNEKNVLLS